MINKTKEQLEALIIEESHIIANLEKEMRNVERDNKDWHMKTTSITDAYWRRRNWNDEIFAIELNERNHKAKVCSDEWYRKLDDDEYDQSIIDEEDDNEN